MPTEGTWTQWAGPGAEQSMRTDKEGKKTPLIAREHSQATEANWGWGRVEAGWTGE